MGNTLSAKKAASSADPRPSLAGFNPNISAEIVRSRRLRKASREVLSPL